MEHSSLVPYLSGKLGLATQLLPCVKKHGPLICAPPGSSGGLGGGTAGGGEGGAHGGGGVGGGEGGASGGRGPKQISQPLYVVYELVFQYSTPSVGTMPCGPGAEVPQYLTALTCQASQAGKAKAKEMGDIA